MEITTELLQKIYERVEHVFFAKTERKPNTIEIIDDGSFLCTRSWNVGYMETDFISEIITADDLTADLDEMVKIRKTKEEAERKEQEKQKKENFARYEKEQKENRLAEYNRLKKEFE